VEEWFYMSRSSIYKEKVAALLKCADIRIGGDRPWDLQVHNPDTYGRILGEGTIGFGEAYMEGWWDCEALDEFFTRVQRAEVRHRVQTWHDKIFFLKAWLLNRQTGKRSFKVGQQHYDAGNDLYERMLDKRMIYTCGYWRNVDSLDDAQEQKLDLVCRKLDLKPGMRVLDIGCGWGGAAKFAVEKYGVEVVGITISREQVELGNATCAGLPVEIRMQDYKTLDEPFDRIFSLGMFEHVGFKNYRLFFEIVNRCLSDDGLFLLHTIGARRSSVKIDPWLEKYIFSNSVLPSIKLIGGAIEGLFVMEDWHNFRTDYDKTLLAWYRNINDRWHELPAYDETFQRMWNYYLMAVAGGFRAGNSQLWQIVFSKRGMKDRYEAPR
jgi:cyclopropane-fatty-acyl-phospholipid synthase